MTADKMFKNLGFRPDSFNGVGNILKYFYEIKNNSNARFVLEFDFNDDNGNYVYYYQLKDPLDGTVMLEKQVRVSVDLHKAITQQMIELGLL